MVSTLMHIIWSATAAKFAGIKNITRVLFLGIFLDFDFILDFFFRRPIDHRDYFHNIFFISAVLFAIWLFERKDREKCLLKSASMAFILHLLLDAFDGSGVPLLFPVSSERLLIYSITTAYDFPIKLFWEGNIYFTAASFSIMLIAICSYKNALSK